MTVQAENIPDLIVSTQVELGKMKFTELGTDLQDFIALPNIMRKEKVQFDSGTSFEKRIMIDNSGAAKNVGIGEVDTPAIGEVMTTINVPWRMTTTDYSITEDEIDMNRQPAKIVDLLLERRVDALLSLAVKMEDNFWSKPDDSGDLLEPYGVPLWIVSTNSTATGAFEGGNPSGFSAGAGGIESVANPRWANWTFQYSTVNNSDFKTKLRLMAYKTAFKSPVPHPSTDRSGGGKGFRRAYYTNFDVLAPLQSLAEAQNENLGFDIDASHDMVMFQKKPIISVPQLDSDSADPIFQIDWNVLYPVFLNNWFMREKAPVRSKDQHNMHTVFIDNKWNMLSSNRRKTGYGSK